MGEEKAPVDPNASALPNTPPQTVKELFGSSWGSYVFAAVFTVAYLFFLKHMVCVAGKTESATWERLLYLFTGIESIVFTVAGFLFGRQVNLRRAITAENQEKKAEVQRDNAEEEKKKAKEAQVKAEKQGRDLALAALSYDPPKVQVAGLIPHSKVDWETVLDKAKQVLA